MLLFASAALFTLLFRAFIDSFIWANRLAQIKEDAHLVGQQYVAQRTGCIRFSDFESWFWGRESWSTLNCRKLVYDESGRLVLDTKHEAPLASVVAEQVNRVFTVGETTAFVQDAATGADFFVFGAPVKQDNRVVGVVLYHGTYKGYFSIFRNVVVLAWVAAAGSGMLLLILGTVISVRLINPLLEMNRTTREIARGNFAARVRQDAPNEIGQLAESINYMALQLQEVENARRRFLENVSHELRTPVGAIRGMAQALLEGQTLPQNRQGYLELIFKESLRTSRLIDDLLELTLVQSPAFRLNLQREEVIELLRRSLAKFEPAFKEKRIDAEVRVPVAQKAFVLGDRDRLTQILDNLLRNALMHTPDGGYIVVESLVSRQTVEIVITNSGPGISEEDLPHIFERFYKADKARRSGGNGLGLAITKHLVELHRGEIAASSANGETRFTLRLTLDGSP